MRHRLAAPFVVCVIPCSGNADVRELSSSELRDAVTNDRAIASYRLIDGVEDYTGGSVVDVRAFDVDGAVAYRILVRNDDGGLGAIMLEGDSGRVIMPSTPVGREVSELARELPQSSMGGEDSAAPSRGNPGNTGNSGGGNGGGSNNGNGGSNNGNGGSNNGNGGSNNGNGGSNNGNGGGNNGNGNGGGNNGNGGGGGNNGNGNGNGNGGGNGKGRDR